MSVTTWFHGGQELPIAPIYVPGKARSTVVAGLGSVRGAQRSTQAGDINEKDEDNWILQYSVGFGNETLDEKDGHNWTLPYSWGPVQ